MQLVQKSAALLKRTQFTVAEDTPRANWFQRAFCVILDFFIAMFAALFVLVPLQMLVGEEKLNSAFGLTGKVFSDGEPVSWVAVVFYLSFAFYRPLCQGLLHQTIGERLLKIYVANADRTQLRMDQVLKRHACPALIWISVAMQFYVPEGSLLEAVEILLLFGALLLWVCGSVRAFKSDRRTVLDLFSGAYVYKKR